LTPFGIPVKPRTARSTFAPSRVQETTVDDPLKIQPNARARSSKSRVPAGKTRQRAVLPPPEGEPPSVPSGRQDLNLRPLDPQQCHTQPPNLHQQQIPRSRLRSCKQSTAAQYDSAPMTAPHSLQHEPLHVSLHLAFTCTSNASSDWVVRAADSASAQRWTAAPGELTHGRATGDAVCAGRPRRRQGAPAGRVHRPAGRRPGPAGVGQFLDIGTGLPTADNTHDVAQRFAPQAGIVYVDNDPLVLAQPAR
jgi:hypothetical protein